MKRSNIYVIGVVLWEERKNGAEIIFEKSMANQFSKLMKNYTLIFKINKNSNQDQCKKENSSMHMTKLVKLWKK